MYLTKFQMNPARRETLHLIGSPQRMHAAVLGAFPPDAVDGAASRVLWRLDEPARHERNLYLVGPLRPSLDALQDSCGWSQQVSWRTADYGPFLERLDTGQQWRFRLTGNPVRTVRSEHGQRGIVSPHITVDQQRQWLIDRARQHGFSPVSGEHGQQVEVTRRERESFGKGGLGQRRRATITRAQFDGLLEVTDVELLRHALVHGIGRAKAYGCGLLTLAPTQ